MLSFILNREPVETDASPGTLLLDFIRYDAKLPGTKDACREGECGSCTVLIGKPDADGRPRYKACASCLLPIGDVAGCHVVTVEGVDREEFNAIQRLIIEENAAQCGYCTPGIILSLAGFALSAEAYSYAAAVDALDGNICRCTGYASIRRAAVKLAEALEKNIRDRDDRIPGLVEYGVLPEYFLSIADRIRELKSAPSGPGREGEVVVAGGTDLFVQKPEELLESPLFFLSGRRDLDYVREEDGSLRVGSAITLEDFRLHPLVNRHLPAMREDVLLHSSTILRNKATLSGNIVNASPIGDITIMFLALGAVLELEAAAGGIRQVALSEFYRGYKDLDLNPGEIVREMVIPVPGPGVFYNFEKVSNRKILDIAAVNSAILLETKGEKIARIALSGGGVAPVPLLIEGLDKFAGKKVSPETFEELSEAAMAAVAPIDDVRGSAEYKRLLLGQLVRAHFQKYSTRRES